MIHVGASVLQQGETGSFDWSCCLIWGSLMRGSVPLFLMASGAILLDPKKTLPLKKLYLHNIARIVAAMLVWGFCYKLYHLTVDGNLGLAEVSGAIKELLLFDQEFHFYYLHIILLVYICLPITRKFAEHADKKTMEYALCVWIVLAIVYPTLWQIAPFSHLNRIPAQWRINLTYASVGYGLWGYYLIRYPLTQKRAIISFCFGLFITFFITFYLSARNGALNDSFLQGTSPGVFLLATGIFSILNHTKVPSRLEHGVVSISKASFCVYLSHMFVLYALSHFGVTAGMFPAIFSVPFLSAVVLAVCLVLYRILSKIPLLNRWII